MSSAVRRRMETQRRQGTRPELELRRLLHAAGFRYRVGLPVPGLPRRTIDVAFTRSKVAVFVDGCFWHRCPEHFVPPRNNHEWWAAKLDANTTRDEDTTRVLVESGWHVVRVWEHESLGEAVARITALLG